MKNTGFIVIYPVSSWVIVILMEPNKEPCIRLPKIIETTIIWSNLISVFISFCIKTDSTYQHYIKIIHSCHLAGWENLHLDSSLQNPWDIQNLQGRPPPKSFLLTFWWLNFGLSKLPLGCLGGNPRMGYWALGPIGCPPLFPNLYSLWPIWPPRWPPPR